MARRKGREDKKLTMDKTDLAYAPASELVDLIAGKALSPVELMETTLARLDDLNPKLNAVCTPTPELAMEGARKAEDLAEKQSMPSAPMEAKIASYRKSVTYGSTPSPKQRAVQMSRIDPDAQIQTGPGLPQWSWTRIHMGWNGPVEQGQNLKLYLCPPWLTSLLNLVRVTLLIALGAFLLIITRSKKSASPGGAITMPPLAAFLFFSFGLGSGSSILFAAVCTGLVMLIGRAQVLGTEACWQQAFM